MPPAPNRSNPGTRWGERVLRWYDANARTLPWRDADARPWGVLVSEIMLQQTPVARVVPAYLGWLTRWPSPERLAAAPLAEALRTWGTLGYPRRARALHATAGILTERYDGTVPSTLDDLLALPGVGDYTARAVASFAFGQRHPVVDTNVRRVLARAVHSRPAATGSPAGDRRWLADRLPDEGPAAARFGVALMELGALVCRPRTPACAGCPVAPDCRWMLDGRPAERDRPALDGRRPAYVGTNRQARGRLLAAARTATHRLDPAELAAAWPDPAGRGRALAGLVADGLLVVDGAGRVSLPG